MHHPVRWLPILMLALLGATPPALRAEPVLSCAEPHHDFGIVSSQQEVSCTFIVKNSGTTNLVISKVQSSCSCVVSDNKERVIAPGQESGIDVTFKLKGLHGKQRKAIYLQTNDKTASYFRLSLAVDIRQAVNVRPDSVFFGQLGDNYETVTRTVQIEADETGSVVVTGLETNDLHFCRVKVEPITEKKKYRISLELPSGVLQKTGIYKGDLVVLTDHPSYPRIRIPVTAMMRKDILVTPQTILIKPTGTVQTRNLVVRSTRKDDIESVTATCPGDAQASVEKLAPNQYLIRILNLKATVDLQDKAFVLTVKFASGAVETLHVPVELAE
jgi:hypothetical protein